MEQDVILGVLVMLAFGAALWHVLADPGRAPSDWVHSFKHCHKDSNKSCPYRWRVRWHGGLEVDTASLVACCKFRDTCDAVERLAKRSPR